MACSQSQVLDEKDTSPAGIYDSVITNRDEPILALAGVSVVAGEPSCASLGYFVKSSCILEQGRAKPRITKYSDGRELICYSQTLRATESRHQDWSLPLR